MSSHSPRLPLVVLLGAALACGLGCKCSKDSAADAGARVAPGAASRSPSWGRGDGGPSPLELPVTPSTLSLLEPSGGGCEWQRVDPLAKQKLVVARFDGDCRGARIAWSHDGSRALVWFDPETMHVEAASQKPGLDEAALPDVPDRLFEVQLATGEVSPLPFPEVQGSVDEVALGADGQIVALVQESLTEEVRRAGKVEVEGEPFHFQTDAEGLPALAHAYRLAADGKWRRFETKTTTEGWDYALGVDALEASKGLGPRSVQLLVPHYQGDSVADPELAERLAPFRPEGEAAEGGWIQGGTSAGRFYVWEVTSELSYTTGRVLLDAPKGPVPAPQLGFDETTLVSLRVQGPFLLVAHNATGRHPRLYDLRTRTRVFASDTARAATFWPGGAPAAGPAEHAD